MTTPTPPSVNIQRILSRIKYRPHWRFYLDSSGDVKIDARVKDSYNPRAWAKDRIETYVTDPWRYHSEHSLLRAIMEAVEALEFHEAREWFTYRGRHLFDPHA